MQDYIADRLASSSQLLHGVKLLESSETYIYVLGVNIITISFMRCRWIVVHPKEQKGKEKKLVNSTYSSGLAFFQ